jgi:hypothetical protein
MASIEEAAREARCGGGCWLRVRTSDQEGGGVEDGVTSYVVGLEIDVVETSVVESEVEWETMVLIWGGMAATRGGGGGGERERGDRRGNMVVNRGEAKR